MRPSLGLDPFPIPRKHGRVLLTLGSQVLEGLSGEAGESRHHGLSRGVEADRGAWALGWCWGQSEVQRGPMKEEEQIGQSQRLLEGSGKRARRPSYPGRVGAGAAPSVVFGQPLCL